MVISDYRMPGLDGVKLLTFFQGLATRRLLWMMRIMISTMPVSVSLLQQAEGYHLSLNES